LFLGCWMLLEWWMRFFVVWDLSCLRLVCSLVCAFLLHAWNSGEYCQSHLSEIISPRRECLRLVQVLLEQLAQTKGPCLWATRCLAQARVTRPSEFSKKNMVCSARILVQARGFIFGRMAISPRRAGLAQARASRVPLLQASPRRECLA